MSANSSFSSNRCEKCHQLIVIEDEYLHDGDNIIHINCYNCSTCHRSLAGRFYYRYKDPRKNEKRQVYCDSCYHRLAPVCFHCLKIIDDISLIYGERIFHPNCFRCNHCQKPFQGALVFPYENQVYCSKCYSKVQKHFHPTSSTILTSRCSVCRKKFEAGDLLTKHQKESIVNIDQRKNEDINNVHYIHTSCFVCIICHQNLSNSIYYSPNSEDEDGRDLGFQCEKCHQTSASICYNCFQPSNDLMVIYNHRWYHDECFKCKNCDYQLKNLTRIITEADGLLCERCLKLMHDQQQQQQ